MKPLTAFARVVLVDFEFRQLPGERPQPWCVVAREWRSGHTIRHWLPGEARSHPPYPVDSHTLFVAYYSSAELGCHLALGWPLPTYVCDLYTEFRCLSNGLTLPVDRSLLGALETFGLDGIAAREKAEMRALAMRGGPWTHSEQQDLLAYCETDVLALGKLLTRMALLLDWSRSLLRGRYMKAVARMEHAGIPLQSARLLTLRQKWPGLHDTLIARVDQAYHVFEGGSFRRERWEQWAAHQGIAWPRLDSGQLALDKQTFRDMSRAYPQVNPMRELRASLSELRLEALAVGHDGRNRCLLSPFGSRTGRNSPSNTKFIFGPATWIRHLITSEPGHGLAYLDWSAQEIGIAGVLSGDTALQDAYQSGDPYLRFAQQAGAVPPTATKASHGALRDLYKTVMLGTNYGLSEVGLATRLQLSRLEARELLAAHKRTYRQYWRWVDGVRDYAYLHRRLSTTFGWTLHVEDTSNPRSVGNFPLQANGAEMLRIALCLATEQGVEVCAPVHDGVLIHAPLPDLADAVALMQSCMQQASAVVLEGFVLRTEASVWRYPEHYSDPRGTAMWQTVWSIIASDRDSKRDVR